MVAVSGSGRGVVMKREGEAAPLPQLERGGTSRGEARPLREEEAANEVEREALWEGKTLPTSCGRERGVRKGDINSSHSRQGEGAGMAAPCQRRTKDSGAGASSLELGLGRVC